MSDDNDNIIEFPLTVNLEHEDTVEDVLEVLECDNCANKTWQIDPEGILTCPICKTNFDFKGYLLD